MPPLRTYKVIFEHSGIVATIYAYDLKQAKKIADKYLNGYNFIATE